jgi:amidase
MPTTADLPDLPASDIAALIRSKDLSARDVMRAHIERIETWNPRVNAVVSHDLDRAMKVAGMADDAQARGEPLGPLHGLPVAHKDLFHTRGVRTTLGSRAFENFIPEADSIVVERQRLAGAIAVGKTNVPEFGAGSNTFNDIFGITRNPYALACTAGGSSGGAAAALATGMVALADGSDMGGSLRNPASFCNVVGLRPSFGCVPMWPSANRFSPLSVAGPMGRTVKDAALLLSVLAGQDIRDPLCAQPGSIAYHEGLERDFAGVRIAWSADLGGLPFEPQVVAATARGLTAFADLGCTIEEACPDLTGAYEAFHVFRALSMANAYRKVLERDRDKLKDTVVWNIERGLRLTADQVLDAEAARNRLFQAMHDFMETYEFLVAPVAQVTPFTAETEYPVSINGQPMQTYVDWQQSLCVISITGHPAISVPCAFTPDGLPVGIQIIGRYRDERGVLQLAHAVERLMQPVRRRPQLPAA